MHAMCHVSSSLRCLTQNQTSPCLSLYLSLELLFLETRLQLGNMGRSLNASRGVNYKWNRQIFTMSNVSMMVDSGSTAKRGPIVDLLTGKDDDGGFVCRGWKSAGIVFLFFPLKFEFSLYL
ncbi:hypothetical protein OIU79_029828 [Salix purpurea]|uniref:Uncharacterized protein n=1 Tax=Salix purpurea TaxID=77065 RepID=A0A9Q0VHA1_SALPP|nr:hypothetical protein OIU79_029828 [Salix purpurea]